MVARVNQVPANCRHLDLKEIERTLVANCGNVSRTARQLGVPSADLRALVWSGPLADVIYDQLETDLEKAQQVVFEALRSDDKALRRQAAHIMLTRTDAGRARGFGAVGYLPTGKPMGGPKKYDVLDRLRSPDDGSGPRKH